MYLMVTYDGIGGYGVYLHKQNHEEKIDSSFNREYVKERGKYWAKLLDMDVRYKF